jgi:hypothetical protein
VLESFPDDEDFESMADVMKAYGEAGRSTSMTRRALRLESR